MSTEGPPPQPREARGVRGAMTASCIGLCTLSLEFGRKQGSTKEEQERRRLIHKHKQEFRGAVREIRKDSQFLARTRLSEIMER